MNGDEGDVGGVMNRFCGDPVTRSRWASTARRTGEGESDRSDSAIVDPDRADSNEMTRMRSGGG